MLKWLVSWFGVVGEFLVAILQHGLKKELEIILPIAYSAVDEQEERSNFLSGGEKRDAAFEQIMSELIAAQIIVAASTVYFAIEWALTKWKADRGVE
jgi:hypothetical protein